MFRIFGRKATTAPAAASSTDMVVQTSDATALAVTTAATPPPTAEKIVEITEDALAVKSCFRPSEQVTVHNAVVAITTANSAYAAVSAPSTCDDGSSTAAVVGAGINIIGSQIAQFSDLYGKYKELSRLQEQFIRAIPFQYVERISTINAAGESVVLTGTLDAETLNAFLYTNGNATIKMVGSEIGFSLKYQGIFQGYEGARRIAGMVLSAAATALFLSQHLSTEVDSVLRAQGSGIYTAASLVPNVPFMSFAGALDRVLHNHTADIYAAAARIVGYYKEMRLMQNLSTEMQAILALFVDAEDMIQVRKGIVALTDVEAGTIARPPQRKSIVNVPSS